MDSIDGQPLVWHQIWVHALTRPWPANYRTLIQDPQASPARGYWWILAASIFDCVAWVLLLSYAMERAHPNLFDSQLKLKNFFELTLLGVVVGGVVTLVVVINAVIQNQLAQWLGGTGTFADLVYAESLVVPLAVILIPLYFIPLIYVLLLNVISVKAVHHLSSIKAVIPVAVTMALWFGLILFLASA